MACAQQTADRVELGWLANGAAVCLDRTGTGRLPNALPAGLAQGPFGGQDFEHAETDTGFVLRGGRKDLDKNEVSEFPFTLN